MNWQEFFTYDNMIDLAISIGIFLLFLVFRKLFAKYVFTLLLKLGNKSPTKLFAEIFIAFKKPVEWTFTVIGIYIAASYFPHFNQGNEFFKNMIGSMYIFLFTWGFFNLASADSIFFKGINKKMEFDKDNIIIPLLSKALRFIIVAIALTVVLQQFGYNVTGFVAGLGLGGLAISLAAQDILANMIGGFVIITEKPFTKGDWIVTPSIDGTVEEIAFRSTKVRTAADALVVVPNATLVKEPITNWSKMDKRQNSFDLTLTYETPQEKVETVVRQIDYLLKNNPEIDQETILVKFNKYNENGYNIMVYYFTKTTAWAEYVSVNETVNFNIMELLRDENIELAVPARALYVQDSRDSQEKNAMKRESDH
ncbi:mechanosensitive ion channel family protein [Oceanobacillus chungangensis]|uniref:Mechanosensitive ion channel protein n=1 Tax=Oceanobacillus chungangensis TaxID=1229152 RepID=A0A3D8PL64_9BACI|nr:mechanosensitive ion channel family protein [Oceanobacillus chungangensis]RDW16227.1 mechanosensitive ion channel protein [Oceanobacillus chungangensis]